MANDRIPLRALLWDLFQSVVGANALKKRTIGRYISAPGRIRPEPEEPLRKRLYYMLDRGEHFRNIEEFKSLFSDTAIFRHPSFDILEARKLGVEVIDGVVIRARKQSAFDP